MGGKALKRVQTRRLDRDEYQGVERHVIQVMSRLADKVGVPRYFKSKTSFGDLDVVYTSANREQVVTEAMKEFGSCERVRNGHVDSIDCQLTDKQSSFQIDLIWSGQPGPTDNFEGNMFYLSYGDMGAILGTVVRPYGLGYGGEPGLFHQVCVDWDTCKNVGRIQLTQDPVDVCQVLGISDVPVRDCYAPMTGIDAKNVFGGGDGVFQEYDQVFDYIAGSPLFRPDFWTARSVYWNSDQRSRVDARPMYRNFVEEYLPTKFGFRPDVQLDHSIEVEKTVPFSVEEREIFVNATLERFGLREQREQMIEDYRHRQEAKKKFSGEIVMSLVADPDLTGKRLGEFMKALKGQHPELFETDFILDQSQETINTMITEFYGHLTRGMDAKN